MANLKDLRNRITSVKSTIKITSAMKMVAASRLRKAQQNLEEARQYISNLDLLTYRVIASLSEEDLEKSILVRGRESAKHHRFIVIGSDRGLCGGLNANVIKRLSIEMAEKESKGMQCSVLCLGRKPQQVINARLGKDKIVDFHPSSTRDGVDSTLGHQIGMKLVEDFYNEEYDTLSIISTKFNSAISQEVVYTDLIPLGVEHMKAMVEDMDTAESSDESNVFYEPSKEEFLDFILPKNIENQIYKGLAEGYTSEQGARMTAMDNATNNAKDMIGDLTIKYNNSRQAIITNELIEIISGAESL